MRTCADGTVVVPKVEHGLEGSPTFPRLCLPVVEASVGGDRLGYHSVRRLS